MKEYSAEQLFDLLNQQDECSWIEAKKAHDKASSAMETVCSFSNEPFLGGGYILLGVAETNASSPPRYKTIHIDDPDTVQKDFASQCSTMFNIPIRPIISVEKVHGDTVIKVAVEELEPQQKPLYFKNRGLSKGAYRRVGSTDQRCTEDDLRIFYKDDTSYDQTSIQGVTLDDVDKDALKMYRTLRGKVNPTAVELNYADDELLGALGCVNKKNENELNLAGLILFGTSKVLRSSMPMARADYIRVPGNEWIENPDDRFTTIDMRGPLLTLIFRLIEAANSDLPQGFLLPEGKIQATSVGLPTKVLREAIVNAVMHRSYRVHRPIQVIRYDNRIEIINPGYSLKSEDLLGEPGSEIRNPFIAEVFHETNLAETKGSGIRAMRKLMTQSHLAPPTFDSDRDGNQFVSRLLLHHFLDEEDVKWLSQYEGFKLGDGQKQALIFARETGAIDNRTYRQMNDCDTLKASTELRVLKSTNLLTQKEKGKAAYYVPGPKLNMSIQEISTPPQEISTPPQEISTPPQEISTPPQEISTPPQEISKPSQEISTQPQEISTQPQEISTQPQEISTQPQEISTLPQISGALKIRINALKEREHNPKKIEAIILEICAAGFVQATHVAEILKRGEDYVKRKYLGPMIKDKRLVYRHPDMLNHPNQAYKSNKNS